jgi:rubrerythrin
LQHQLKGIDMASKTDTVNINELLYQALETELGGIKVYETALKCAVNEDLKEEWGEYLDETLTHREVLLSVFTELGLDPDATTPGRQVVGHIGQSLVKAMEMAKASGTPEDAELVAAECVVLAETKDHANWELIGLCAKKLSGTVSDILKKAHDAVEKDEDHHLYHTKGWSRELWIASLGFPAVLPPPEEVRQVESAIGAAHAKTSRDQMLEAKGQA